MWWLEFLLVAFFAMGWFPCCCTMPTIGCACCDPNDLAPETLYADVTGMANIGCTHCEDFNGTWELSHVSGDADTCSYKGADITGLKIREGVLCQDALGWVSAGFECGAYEGVFSSVNLFKVGLACNDRYDFRYLGNFGGGATDIDCMNFNLVTSPSTNSTTCFPLTGRTCDQSTASITVYTA